jgi:hypothetical protein
MNIDKFQRATDNLPVKVINQYFNGNRNLFDSIVLSLHEKIDRYPIPQTSQPISLASFKNYLSFLPYCLDEPNLIGSILYLNLAEPTFLLSDVKSFSNSNKIKWGAKPNIESIATAEQIFQDTKQKISELLKSPKISKKDANAIIKLVEPLSEAKFYNDIQKIYWMLYCELRFTLQLLKPDKDFEISFGFDKAWLDLRENDVPLLKILSQTSIEDYLEPDFEETTKEQIRTSYLKDENQTPQIKVENKVSDSAPKSLLGHVDGLQWEDITIILNSLDTVIIKALDHSNEYHYSQLDMSDKRKKGKADSSWKLLCLFAMGNGTVSYTDIEQTRNYSEPKKAISILQKKLKQIIGLQDNPIANYESNVGYKAKFYIKSDIPQQYLGSKQQEADIELQNSENSPY